MKTSKSLKVLAVFLALLFLIPQAVAAEGAATGTSDKSTMDEVIELLEMQTYDEYLQENIQLGWKDATGTGVTVKAAEGFTYTPDSEYASTAAEVRTDEEKGSVLYTPEAGIISWPITVAETGFYVVRITYKPVESSNTANIKRKFAIDGKVPYKEANYLELTRCFTDDYADVKRDDETQGFTLDKNGNEKKPTKSEVIKWSEYYLSDSAGYYMDPLKFALTAGEHTISFEADMNELLISEIVVEPYAGQISYAEYLAANGSKNASIDADRVIVQGETPDFTSEVTIYALNDRTSPITQPQHASKQLLNTIGDSKWNKIGQWIEWTIPGSQIKDSGYYFIVPRFKQSTLAGLYVSRRLYINGEVPFKEAGYCQFNYSDDWQCTPLNDGTQDLKFYFEAGKDYTIRLEVVYGNMAEILRGCEESLTAMNEIYNSILKITGPSPDEYSYYGFAEVIYDTILQMKDTKVKLQTIVDEFEDILGGKSAGDIATLEKVIWILEKMSSKESEIAKNHDNLKVNSGTLGTWIMNTKLQGLNIDYISLQPAVDKKEDLKLPRGSASFWSSFTFEIKAFFASFFTDYNSLGSSLEDENIEIEPVNVWIATSRDEAQVMRELVDNYCDVYVNLKLVAGGTILPATLAGDGPDVSLAMGQSEVINYAIRSAIQPLSQFEDYYDVVSERFSPETIVGLRLENPDEPGVYDYYGVPERLGFSMLFYRKDIFAQLGIDVPKTWDDLYEIVPVLQVNYRKVGFPSSLGGLQMLMYQKGEDLYSDIDGDGNLDGMQINIGSYTSLQCFEQLCELFQTFKFPRVYDLATYFRMGEMPIAVSDYMTYNQFTIYATELKGLWAFTVMPGTVQRDDNGDIILDENGIAVVNNDSPCSVSAVVMLKDNSKLTRMKKTDPEAYALHKENCWKFIKWWTDAPAQSEYAKQYEALIGMAAKFNTANTQALKSMPWTTEERKALEAQFANLKGTPEYPGGYIIGRYVDFAFLNCYNNNADPTESLLDQLQYINNELSRKRKEFGLVTYEQYKEQFGTEHPEWFE